MPGLTRPLPSSRDLKHKPLDRAANDPCYKIGVTLRDALAEILTAPILAERPDRRIETEYIVAEALFRFRFFHTLEKVITWLTGLTPREDDIGKRAALVVAQQPLPPLPELPKIVLPSIELPLDLQDVTGRPAARPD